MVFGHSEFRKGQREAVEDVLAGKDVLVLWPTGGGKSLAYQLPAVMRAGLTVVISPLLALMHDQVEHLRARGVRAVSYSSKTPAGTRREIVRSLGPSGSDSERPQLLYAAAEMATNEAFMRDVLRPLYERRALAQLVVDEAHVVSQWGVDFRTSYRQLTRVREALPGVPLCALTATATARVREDIVKVLGMRDVRVHAVPFNRPNIAYCVRYKDALGSMVDRDIVSVVRAAFAGRISDVVAGTPAQGAAEDGGGVGIVYCHKKDTCEEVARTLTSAGISTSAYHGGMKADERVATQTAWVEGRVRVVAATIAFGMGIDKPDVRVVVHHSLPQSMEGFYQESGRAGRDGRPAVSVLYYGAEDRRVREYLLGRSRADRETRVGPLPGLTDSTVRAPSAAHDEAAQLSFSAIVAYCADARCRRAALLSYFADSADRGNGARCCDYCANPAAVRATLDRLTSTPTLRSEANPHRRPRSLFASDNIDSDEDEPDADSTKRSKSFSDFQSASSLIERKKQGQSNRSILRSITGMDDTPSPDTPSHFKSAASLYKTPATKTPATKTPATKTKTTKISQPEQRKLSWSLSKSGKPFWN